MSDQEIHITEQLIIEYLNGNLSDKSTIKQLEKWLANADNLQQAKDIYKTWEVTMLASPARKNTDDAFSMLEGKLQPIRNPRSKSISLWWYAAASVLVISILTVLLVPDQSVEMIVLSTDHALEDFELSDGTVITLNENGEVRYDQMGFDRSNERRLVLKGVAYFDVDHQPEKPFIVETDDAEVKVLGTQFMVKSTLNAPTEVLVTEGKVQVTYASGEIVVLTAKEEVKPQQVDQNMSLVVTPSDDNHLYWKTGVMIFDQDSLGRVFQTLSEEFKTPIRVDNQAILSCNITATFKKQSLDTIIEVIKSTHQLDSYRDQGQIIITGNGCQ
ncbi:MAG: FecR domain-containing protein [Bacteroidota bacterium]